MRGAALTVTCAAQLVLQLDFGVVNVALLTIRRELGMAEALADHRAADAGLRTPQIMTAPDVMDDRLW